MGWVIGFVAVFGLMVLAIARQAKRAGPRHVSDDVLARAKVIVRSTATDPSPGWGELGSKTTAEGLKLRFDADDDPQAEAKFFAGEARAAGNRFAHSQTLTLSSEFTTEHIHTAGYVFRVRLRGTGATVGKQVDMKMMVLSNGEPWAGLIENDDDRDPAMGDWIEFEFVEILEVPKQAA